MMKRVFIIGGLILIILVFLFTKSNNSNIPTPSQDAQEAQKPQQTENSINVTAAIAEETVQITKYGFSPTTITIKAGTNVIWVNKSGETANVSSDPHPVHTTYPPLNLGSFDSEQSVSLIFDKAGAYSYHNHLNPSQQGTIVVE